MISLTSLVQHARNGDTEKARKIIKTIDTKSYTTTQALIDAACNGHAECVRLLIPVSDVEEARKALSSSGLAEFSAVADWIESVRQHDIMAETHSSRTEIKPSSKFL